MTTLAKSKAQALVQPAKPLAVTPNVRLFNSPAAGATLSLSNESTNIVQVVNPASTLSINVDSQNFSAFGANHFVLHVDTTAATEISLNFVRGATILTTKVIEIDADQIAILTFAAITKANDAVSLLAIGHHVVGKSEATDGNGAVGGLLLIPTGADESADGEFQRFVWDGEHVLSPPSNDWSAKLATEDQAAAYSIQMKMPTIVDDMPLIAIYVGDVASYTATTDGSDGNRVIFEAVYVADNSATELRLYAQSFLGGEYAFTDTLIIPAPAAGTVITLEVTQASAVMSWGSESYPLAITSGLLPALSDVLAYSTSTDVPLPLSIKVAQVDEA